VIILENENQNKEISFEELIKKYEGKGGTELVSDTLQKIVNSKGKYKDESIIRGTNLTIGDVKEFIMKKYTMKIINEYTKKSPKKTLSFDKNKPIITNQGYSYFDRAIIMTYTKYAHEKDEKTAKEVCFKCIRDYLDQKINHFSRVTDNQNCSARQYAEAYADSLRKIKIDGREYIDPNWQEIIYKDMCNDVALEYLEEHKKEPALLKVKQCFLDNINKIKEKIETKEIEEIKKPNIYEKRQMAQDAIYYSSSIGNYRSNQEDAFLVMNHPTIRDLKIALVSDGMGGMSNGEVASKITVDEFKNLFSNLKIDPDKVDSKELRKIITEKCKVISERIRREAGNGGATLTGAIIGKNDALIMNIGDSRIYAVNDGNLTQITVDDSLSHIAYENIFKNRYHGMTEDEMRFYNINNIITKYLGAPDEKNTPTFTHIDVKDFDQLVMCSDGVTDCLGYNDIAKTVKMSDPKDFAKRLVVQATTTMSNNPRKYQDKDQNLFAKTIKAGKDNTTAVVVDTGKRSKQKEDLDR